MTGKTRVKVAVYGAAGRMGESVLRAILSRRDCEVGAAIVRAGSPLDGEPVRLPGADALGLSYCQVLEPEDDVDVLVDFSGAQGFDAGLALARQREIAFVSGSTGISQQQLAALQHAAESIPVLWASNFSVGVALLTRLAAEAARVLDETFDVDIVEAHHRHKRDAPSGTALTLGRAIAGAREHAFDSIARYARSGDDAMRVPGEIGFAAVRGGDVVGEHTVIFAGEGERLELTHRAGDRKIFANGAVRAAAWLAGRSAGHYDITDILR